MAAAAKLRALVEDPAVARARSLIHESDAETLREQIELTGIPAPSFAEQERARHVRGRFEALGLTEVRGDEAGNVIGQLPAPAPASGEPGGGAVILCAHLDTVFPAGTDLTVRREQGRIHAPGITDNSRGLAAMLALARVLLDCGIATARPLLFVASTGEEGAGDLYGVKHLFRDGSPLREAAAFIALDGSGVRRIVHRAVGSLRLRIRILGSGGHSWADWGTPNAVHAVGRAIAGIGAIELPTAPRTTLSVTRIGGGTSVNTIPAEAWLDLDLRSEGREPIEQIEAQVRSLAAEAAAAESRGRRRGSRLLDVEIQCIGDRPAGSTPTGEPLVQAALAATRAVGERPTLAASSTDANVPISLGIPAITLGAGGDSAGIHTTEEWYSNERGPEGIERALLTALAVAGIA